MAERRPLIAIPARFAATTSALRYAAEVAAAALVEGIYAAGGEPLVVHPGPVDSTDAEIRARLYWADGVLLPGGGDLAAHWSGQQPHPTMYDVDERQDAFDLGVARVALADTLPLLAVCRGAQVVNVARGGSTIQDMDESIGHHRHRRHDISIVAGSRLRSVLGSGDVHASCYHHQCADRLGEGLVAVATTEDGVVEAVELPEHDGWFVGVQWHPEDTCADDAVQARLFTALVEAARERAVRWVG